MKKYLAQWSILILSALAMRSFSFAAEIPNTTAEFSVFSVAVQQALYNENAREQNAALVIREKIFQNFCTVMNTIGSTTSLPAYVNRDANIYYDPKQSVFIHILCAPYKLTSIFGPINQDPKAYFSKDDWITLGIYGVTEDDIACRQDFDMTNCDVAQVFTSLFHRILSDMFDIKQSQLYGWTTQADDPKDRLNDFSRDYFVWLELCPDKKCEYPKTENRLLAYFKKAEWLRKKLDIINRDHINNVLKNEEVDCAYPWSATYNILACGFGVKWSTMPSAFITMIENEVFFYRLFMAHYMWWMQAERRLLDEEERSLNRATEKIADIVATTQQQIAWTQDAVDMSIRSLREMAATFPIHIGLLIYYEDLYRLRKELVKVVTPLYTLSEKLRNVQKKD